MVTSCCSLPRTKELTINTTDIELDMNALPWATSDPSIGPDSEMVQTNSVPDMLATIFAGQVHLMREYDEIERRNGAVVPGPELFGQLDAREIQIRLKDLAWRITEEISEATNTLKNKPWKQTFVATDVAHFQEEVADALHFFVEFLITAGFTPESIFKMYFRKHAVNQFRQESKY